MKLKSLLLDVPHGFLVDSKWLTARGVSRQSVSHYAKQGWLVRLAHGVYARPNQAMLTGTDRTIAWESMVLSMQQLMNYPVHVGGTTALAREGYGHYVPLKRQAVYLYGRPVPKWAAAIQTDASLELRNCSLFRNLDTALTEEAERPQRARSASTRDWKMRMSMPERAILEAIDELVPSESFDPVDRMFEGLTNLRPSMLMNLLKECSSIKVKRLFFVFADQHAHAWRKHLDDAQIDLGSGDRSYVIGGRLHPKYRITVPRGFVKPATPHSNDIR
jgi:hypothetical protein